jgi:hypothetical protein
MAGLRGSSERVEDGGMEWVAKVGGPVVEWPLAGGGGLHGEAEEGDHGEARVLDLRQLQPLLLLGVGRQGERVKVGAAGVQPLLRVELGVALELDVADHKHLDPDERRDGERQRLAQVGGPIHQLHLHAVTFTGWLISLAVDRSSANELHAWIWIHACHRSAMFTYLASILPGDAGEPLDGEGAEGGEHGPSAVDELALAEPLEAEHLAVGLERGGLDVGGLEPGADDAAGLVLGQVLVQRVQFELQVLHGLPEPERVEPVVADQRAVEVVGRHGAGEPQRPVRGDRRLRHLLGDSSLGLSAAEPKPGHDAPVLRRRVRQAGAQECARRGGHRRRSHGHSSSPRCTEVGGELASGGGVWRGGGARSSRATNRIVLVGNSVVISGWQIGRP